MSEHNLLQQLKEILSPALYAHCTGVAQTAAELAVQLDLILSKPFGRLAA